MTRGRRAAGLQACAGLAVLILEALILAATGASCANDGKSAAAAPRVVVITPSKAASPLEYRGAEAILGAWSGKGAKAELSHAVLPDAPESGSSAAMVSAFIAEAARDKRVAAIVVQPAPPGSAEGFRLAREARAKSGGAPLLCIAGDASEDVLAIEASADLVCDLDRVYRAWLIPWAAREMGAKALVAVYSLDEAADSRTVRERAIMSAAASDLGLTYAAKSPPAGVGAVAYTRAMTLSWLRDYGPDTALYCAESELAAPLIAGAIAGGGIIADAAAGATRAAYAAALGLDLESAKGDPRKELRLLEGAVAALRGRGRFGLWDSGYAQASVEGLAEFALRVVSGEGGAKKDNLKDLLSALDARSNGAAWLAEYDVDPETGVRSANRVLLRQDVYVLGKGYLQSALRTVPAKYLAIRASGQ